MYEDYEYQPNVRRETSVFGTVVVAALTSIVVFFGLRYLEQNGFIASALGQATIEVPVIVGLKAPDARLALKARGLLLVLEAEREDARVVAGALAAQKPLGGSQVRRGSAVYAIVSSGPGGTAAADAAGSIASSGAVASPSASPGALTVPNLVGQAADAAVARLTAAGLRAEVAKTFVAGASAGSVVAMVPAPGAPVAAGALVHLSVAEARPNSAVPKVVGLRLSRAKEALTTAGFQVGKVRFADDEDRAGNVVLGQTPAANTTAPAGSAVDLTVNSP